MVIWVERLVTGPWLSLLLALLAIALQFSPRESWTATNVVLFLLWIAASFLIFKSFNLQLAAGLCLAAAGLLVMCSYAVRSKVELVYAGSVAHPSQWWKNPPKAKVATIRIGNSIVCFNDKLDPIGREVIPLIDRSEFTVELINEKVAVTTAIREADGRLIALVRRNAWKVNVNNAFDRNYDDRAFEVKDQFGDVVFQMAVQEDHIQVQGVWSTVLADGPVKVLVRQTPKEKTAHLKMLRIAERASGENEIPAIFLYPGDLHPGELSEYGKAFFTDKTACQ